MSTSAPGPVKVPVAEPTPLSIYRAIDVVTSIIIDVQHLHRQLERQEPLESSTSAAFETIEEHLRELGRLLVTIRDGGEAPNLHQTP